MACACVALGCGGAPTPAPTVAAYRVGGSVSGLSGSLVLQNTGGDLIAVSYDGPFVFGLPLTAGSAYSVVVAAQPRLQSCTVHDGNSTLGQADVIDISVTCQDRMFMLGGQLAAVVAGDISPATLTTAGQDSLTMAAPGPFVFAEPMPPGSSFDVQASALGQTCTVEAGSGNIGSDDVAAVSVSCQARRFALGGQLAGLGAGAQLQLAHGPELVQLTVNGPFVLPEGELYHNLLQLSIASQPLGHLCRLAPPPTLMPAQDVTDLRVDCVQLPPAARSDFTLSGSLAGAAGPVVVAEAIGGAATLTANGPFLLPYRLADHSPWSLTVRTSPPGQSCAFAAAGTAPAGTITTADVAGLQLTCVALPYRLGGGVAGLEGAPGLQLGLGSEQLNIAADGPFRFASSVLAGASYAASVAAQPVGRSCAMAAASGVMPPADSSPVLVTCQPFLRFTDGQSASLVVGQPSVAANLRLAPSPTTLGRPADLFAWPAVGSLPAGPLWISDTLYRRVVGFAQLPVGMPAQAETVLNQADLFGYAAQGLDGRLNAPAGIDGDLTADIMFVADAATHRVLAFTPLPSSATAPLSPPTFALGQATLAGSDAGCAADRMQAPWGVSYANGVLAVADSGNHRVLIWTNPPSTSGAPADLVLGQSGPTQCSVGPATAGRLAAPRGVWTDGTRLLVADTGHQRVLLWQNIKAATHGAPAQGVLGQPSLLTASANADDLRALVSPQGVAAVGSQIVVSDAGLHRVLIFNTWPTAFGPAADVVLGAPTLYGRRGCNLGMDPVAGAHTLCSPGGLSLVGHQLWLADTNNDRVVMYDGEQ